MKKKLVLRVVKFEKALAIQVLEQEGIKTIEGGRVRVANTPAFFSDAIYLRGSYTDMDFHIMSQDFVSNKERDEYLDDIISTITNELFTENNGELKYGEPCLVRDSSNADWVERIFVAKSPVTLADHCNYIVLDRSKDFIVACKYAKPLPAKIKPIVDDEIFTWEE